MPSHWPHVCNCVLRTNRETNSHPYTTDFAAFQASIEKVYDIRMCGQHSMREEKTQHCAIILGLPLEFANDQQEETWRKSQTKNKLFIWNCVWDQHSAHSTWTQNAKWNTLSRIKFHSTARFVGAAQACASRSQPHTRTCENYSILILSYWRAVRSEII